VFQFGGEVAHEIVGEIIINMSLNRLEKNQFGYRPSLFLYYPGHQCGTAAVFV